MHLRAGGDDFGLRASDKVGANSGNGDTAVWTSAKTIDTVDGLVTDTRVNLEL